MRLHLCFWFIITIMISPVFCEEIAYVYDESGGRPILNSYMNEYNGSDQVTFAVADSPQGGSATYKFEKTIEDIKKDITEKVNRENEPVRVKGLLLVGTRGGSRSIDQICSIYDYLIDEKNWTYVEDWTGTDQYQYSNKTLEYGEKSGILGKGDCDDFAILLAALIESVGGTPRIVFSYRKDGGHAYTEVFLGKDRGPGSDVDRMIKHLQKNYNVNEIYAHNNTGNQEVWLNLDWWKEPGGATHPGGPFFKGDYNITVYPENIGAKFPLTPPNEPPTAHFSFSPTNPNEGENITFNATQSRDLGGKVDRYIWDFGDGSRDEGDSVTHVYCQGGFYTVNLTVIDNEDAKGIYSQVISVNELPNPFISYKPIWPKARDPVYFDASQSGDDDGTILEWEWSFGDGDTSKKPNPIHIYEKIGNYTINLTISDNNGAKNTTTTEVKVNEPPLPIIYFEPENPSSGDELIFDASRSLDVDGGIQKFIWDFGDGQHAEDNPAKHRYMEGGNFTVRLEALDDNGATNSTSAVISINWAPSAEFSYSPENPGVIDPVTFDASKSNDIDGKIISYEWDFGDYIPQKPRTHPVAKYSYGSGGEFNATLTVTDDKGAKDSFSKILIIGGYSGCENESSKCWEPFNSGKYYEALECFEGATSTCTEHTGGWSGKGFVLNMLGTHENSSGRYEGALRAFNVAIELDPKNGGAYLGKGWSLLFLGRDEEALSCFDKIASGQIDADHINLINAWDGKTQALINLRRYQEAMSSSKILIEIMGENNTGFKTPSDIANATIRHNNILEKVGKAWIINPKENSTVASCLTITGEYSPNDLNESIWVFVESLDEEKYYPQSRNPCLPNSATKEKGKWETRIDLGAISKDKSSYFDIVVAIADGGTNQSIADAVSRWWCSSSVSSDEPKGYKVLPEGVAETDRVRVILSSEKWNSSPHITNAHLPGQVNITQLVSLDGIENITATADGDLVVSSMKVYGNCTPDVKDQIWILLYASNGRWYPQSNNDVPEDRHVINVNRAGSEWYSPASFGGSANDSFDVVVILANTTADQFFNEKQRIWSKNTNKEGNQGDFPGLLTIELPAGIEEKDRIKVCHK
jgi:PKD repeat protein